LVNVQATDPLLPARSERALAPNVATGVEDEVLATWVPEQGVPGEETVQEYDNVSPAVGGFATEGPPEGEKSVVTRSWILPVPPVFEVRILYWKFVVPV
jgi:hypothetical protein